MREREGRKERRTTEANRRVVSQTTRQVRRNFQFRNERVPLCHTPQRLGRSWLQSLRRGVCFQLSPPPVVTSVIAKLPGPVFAAWAKPHSTVGDSNCLYYILSFRVIRRGIPPYQIGLHAVRQSTVSSHAVNIASRLMPMSCTHVGLRLAVVSLLC